MRKIINLICDRKVLLGIGIGLVLGVIFMFGYEYNSSLTDAQIEERARGLGMHMKDECKVYWGKDDNK